MVWVGNRGPVGKKGSRAHPTWRTEVTWFWVGNRGPVRKKGSRAQPEGTSSNMADGSHEVGVGKNLGPVGTKDGGLRSDKRRYVIEK